MLTGKKDKNHVAVWRSNTFDLHKIPVRNLPYLTFHPQILYAIVLDKNKNKKENYFHIKI